MPQKLFIRLVYNVTFCLIQAKLISFVNILVYDVYLSIMIPFFIIPLLIVSSMVEWLKHQTDDKHGLSSKPTCAILLCPWKDTLRHFPLLGSLGKQF